MTSVGDTLRRERLKRNLGLDQISRELKISGRMLDAIESDHYDRLPGGVFAKAFVRQYAALLGLDGDELAGQVQRAMEPLNPPSPDGAPKPIAPPIDIPRVEEWTHSTGRRFRLSGSLSAAALVVVVMLICSAVYAWIQRPRTVATVPAPPPNSIHIEHAGAQLPPSQPSTAVSQPQDTGAASRMTPAPSAPSAGTPPGETPTAQTAEAQPAQPATPAGPVHVEIVASEPVWMQAKVDGKPAFTGTMEGNATRVLDGEKDVVIRLGNAGGVTILLNGKPVGEVGPKGQVRTIQLTSGGFQIVSAKPAAPAPLPDAERF